MLGLPFVEHPSPWKWEKTSKMLYWEVAPRFSFLHKFDRGSNIPDLLCKFSPTVGSSSKTIQRHWIRKCHKALTDKFPFCLKPKNKPNIPCDQNQTKHTLGKMESLFFVSWNNLHRHPFHLVSKWHQGHTLILIARGCCKKKQCSSYEKETNNQNTHF